MKVEKIFRRLALAALAFLVLLPFAYTFLASFFSAADFATSPGKILPSSWSFANYAKALSNRWFPTYILNSVATGLLSAFIRMAVAVPASYAFSHLRFKGSNAILGAILLTLFIPSDLLLVGNYATIRALNLTDTYLGIISTSLLPAAQILMLRQHFLAVPSSIRDCAALDGCSDSRYVFSVLLPMSKAILATFFLQSFVGMFNSYLWPLLVTNRPNMRTVQVGITMLTSAESLNAGPTFAAITMVTAPFIAVTALMRRRIMAALAKGRMHI